VSFKAWMNRLRADGYLLCPGSSAVPVDVRGVRRDGVGLHFRCRGTAVRLAAYRPGRAAWQVAVRDAGWCPEESLQLWVHRPLDGTPPPPEARLAFPGDAGPDREVILDGADAWGWRHHEAGLLRPDAAAQLFDHLLAALTSPGATSAVLRADAPSATVSPAVTAATVPPDRHSPTPTVVPGSVPGHRSPTEITVPAARTGARTARPALAGSHTATPSRTAPTVPPGGGRHLPPAIL
jgi:hypothetical protein